MEAIFPWISLIHLVAFIFFIPIILCLKKTPPGPTTPTNAMQRLSGPRGCRGVSLVVPSENMIGALKSFTKSVQPQLSPLVEPGGYIVHEEFMATSNKDHWGHRPDMMTYDHLILGHYGDDMEILRRIVRLGCSTLW